MSKTWSCYLRSAPLTFASVMSDNTFERRTSRFWTGTKSFSYLIIAAALAVGHHYWNLSLNHQLVYAKLALSQCVVIGPDTSRTLQLSSENRSLGSSYGCCSSPTKGRALDHQCLHSNLQGSDHTRHDFRALPARLACSSYDSVESHG